MSLFVPMVSAVHLYSVAQFSSKQKRKLFVANWNIMLTHIHPLSSTHVVPFLMFNFLQRLPYLFSLFNYVSISVQQLPYYLVYLTMLAYSLDAWSSM